MGDDGNQADVVASATSDEVEAGEQTPFECAAHEIHNHLLATNMNYAKNHTRARTMLSSINPSMEKLPVLIRIPVVFHVIWKEEKHNVSLAQIQGQIESLNKSFQMLNEDVEDVPSIWKDRVGNPRVCFFLTKRDEHGNPHEGVVRKESDVVLFASNNTTITETNTFVPVPMYLSPPWDVHHFLNIWVVPRITNAGQKNIIGYAAFPASQPMGEDGLQPGEKIEGKQRDGIVIHHQYFGTNDEVNDVDGNLGRTLVHEMGHYLGVPHIFDDATLEIKDTVRGGQNISVKPLFPKTSEFTTERDGGDMFMNYMDYCDDESLIFFTRGQVERMHNALLTFRPQLFLSSFNLRVRTYQTRMGASSKWNYNILDLKSTKDELICVQLLNNDKELVIAQINAQKAPGNFEGAIEWGNTITLPEGFESFAGHIFFTGPGYLFGLTTAENKTQTRVWQMGSEQKLVQTRKESKLPALNSDWSFLAADWKRKGGVDLVAVKKTNTTNNKVEIHVLEQGENSWDTWLAHRYTALDEIEGGAQFLMTDWNGDGTLDFVAIRRSEDANNKKWLVDILSGASNYREFTIRIEVEDSVLSTAPDYDFVMKNMTGFGRPDLVAIQKSGLPLDQDGTATVQMIVLGA